jgi:hypothetical protein
MGYLIIPLIIGIVAVPSPGPTAQQLTDFARIQRAINRDVYFTDTSGQERVATILGVGTDAVTMEVGRQWTTVHRDALLAVDRVKDTNRDGVVKGVLVGLLVGAVVESAYDDGNGRFLLRGALTYGTLGYMFDRGHTARQPLYRAP